MNTLRLSFPPLSRLVALLAIIATCALSTASEERDYTASIVADPKTETTTVRVRIPKRPDAEPIQSVYLQRRSKTGLDLNIAISPKEGPEDYSVFLTAPTSLAEDAFIKVIHRRKIEPNPDGNFTTTSFIQSGESYEIGLSAPRKI